MHYSCYYTALADHTAMKKKGSKSSHTSLEVALRLYQKKGTKLLHFASVCHQKKKALWIHLLSRRQAIISFRGWLKTNREMSLLDVLSQASTNPFSIWTFPLGSCTVSSAVLDSEARQQSGNYVISTQTGCGQSCWASERSPKPIYTALKNWGVNESILFTFNLTIFKYATHEK